MDFTLKNSKTWVWILTLAFIALNTVLIAKEFYYFGFLSFFLLVGIAGIFYLDWIIFLIVLFTPLSLKLTFFLPDSDLDLFLPTEPLLIATLFLFVMKLIWEKKFDRAILNHPVTLVIILQLSWIFITSITSTIPLVSFKFLAARLWFVVAFYLLATQLFTRWDNIKRFLWFYIIPFTGVIIYTFSRHFARGITNQQASHSSVQPFYNDHTAYGAALGFFVPVIVGFLIINWKADWRKKFFIWVLLLIFLLATLFSYTRATWVSLMGAAVIWVIIKLKINFKYLLFAGIVLFGLVYAFRTDIIIQLEQNKQVSSGDFEQHVKSISNVANDESNLERLNRWSCAIRMFKERPAFGWGPGTYQFQYAPFQNSMEMTNISTYAGDLGNAHSEYIGPLSEQGIPGMLIVFALVTLTIITGLRVYISSQTREQRIMALAVLIGLVTYFIHGLLNNFLDTDKASAPFWGFIAILVALDVYHRKSESLPVRRPRDAEAIA